MAYWKLDEDSGEVRLDSSGNGLHLTDYNYVERADGLYGGAANCTYFEHDRWLQHNDHPLLRFQGDFTVSCWVQRFGTVWGSDTILNVTGSLFLYTDWTTDHQPIFSLYSGGVPFLFLVGELILTEDAWHHLVIYRRGNTFGLITNNSNHVTATATQSVSVGDAFRIGANEAGYPFTGHIDEVGKWNRALSAEEITRLHNNGEGLPLEAF